MSKLHLSTITDRLRHRLAEPLPGLPSQLKMAPSQRAAMLDARDPREARQAAVLVVLEGEVSPSIVLTERRKDLPSHPGQISFPGGRQESNELLIDTALREASEEINLPGTGVEIIGELTPLFVPPSNYMVHPFVAYSREVLDLRPADGEVSEIIRASLDRLLDPSTRRIEHWKRYGGKVEIPLFDLGDYKVWGATAMMLSELIDLIQPD
ncbi:MAG: CoA pyrophosphatase [Rhodothermia bacterium]|nr:CoA pyrophosphatase [Rhodothermia bacterium]